MRRSTLLTAGLLLGAYATSCTTDTLSGTQIPVGTPCPEGQVCDPNNPNNNTIIEDPFNLPPTTGTEERSELTVTGQLGDVMKESARIALSYVRSHRDALGIAPGADQRSVHVHFPAGAVPKDGPSAGITMTTALVSLFTGRTVKANLAMTGEVTLQGRVLPIGGVKQKLLAAHRLGLTEVIIPARNEPDLDDLPEAVRAELTVHLASDVADVIGWALDPASEVAAA